MESGSRLLTAFRLDQSQSLDFSLTGAAAPAYLLPFNPIKQAVANLQIALLRWVYADVLASGRDVADGVRFGGFGRVVVDAVEPQIRGDNVNPRAIDVLDQHVFDQTEDVPFIWPTGLAGPVVRAEGVLRSGRGNGEQERDVWTRTGLPDHLDQMIEVQKHFRHSSLNGLVGVGEEVIPSQEDGDQIEDFSLIHILAVVSKNEGRLTAGIGVQERAAAFGIFSRPSGFRKMDRESPGCPTAVALMTVGPRFTEKERANQRDFRIARCGTAIESPLRVDRCMSQTITAAQQSERLPLPVIGCHDSKNRPRRRDDSILSISHIELPLDIADLGSCRDPNPTISELVLVQAGDIE